MNLQKSPFRFITAFLVTCILVAGCQPQPGSTATSPAQDQNPPAATSEDTGGQTISAGILLDPALAQDGDSLTVSTQIYEGLVKLDSTGSPSPALAESWVLSDDQLDYIFTIRTGLKFSDGTSITPDVIVDNFNRWFDPASPLHTGGDFKNWESVFLGFNGEKDDNKHPKSPIDGIQKVDINTVIIHLNRPVPELLTDLANPAFTILSTESLKTPGYGTQSSTIISSGPYMVAGWTDTSLTLSPNPNYWGTVPSGDLTYILK